jgi:hypothetical protein
VAGAARWPSGRRPELRQAPGDVVIRDHATQGTGDSAFERLPGESRRPRLHEIQDIQPGPSTTFGEGDPADEQAPEPFPVQREDEPDADPGQGRERGAARQPRDGKVRGARLARLAIGGQGEAAVERRFNPPGGEGASNRQRDGGRVVQIQGHGGSRGLA